MRKVSSFYLFLRVLLLLQVVPLVRVIQDFRVIQLVLLVRVLPVVLAVRVVQPGLVPLSRPVVQEHQSDRVDLVLPVVLAIQVLLYPLVVQVVHRFQVGL